MFSPLFVCWLVGLFVRLFVCLFVCLLFVCLFVCLSVCMSVTTISQKVVNRFSKKFVERIYSTCPKEQLIKFWFNLDEEQIRHLQNYLSCSPSQN